MPPYLLSKERAFVWSSPGVDVTPRDSPIKKVRLEKPMKVIWLLMSRWHEKLRRTINLRNQFK